MATAFGDTFPDVRGPRKGQILDRVIERVIEVPRPCVAGRCPVFLFAIQAVQGLALNGLSSINPAPALRCGTRAMPYSEFFLDQTVLRESATAEGGKEQAPERPDAGELDGLALQHLKCCSTAIGKPLHANRSHEFRGSAHAVAGASSSAGRWTRAARRPASGRGRTT